MNKNQPISIKAIIQISRTGFGFKRYLGTTKLVHSTNLSNRSNQRSQRTTLHSDIINQIKRIPQNRLLPSQKKLLQNYLAFLCKNFSDVNQTSNSLAVPLEKDEKYKQLNAILAKIYTQNQTFSAYLDACIQTNEVQKAIKLLEKKRINSRLPNNIASGNFIQSDIIFELLCQHFCEKTDWVSIEQILRWLQEDGILTPPNVIYSCLECLGKLLIRSNPTKKTPTQFLAGDKMLNVYLENKISEVLDNAESQNINIYNSLMHYPRKQNSLHNILTALFYTHSEKILSPKFVSPSNSIEDNKTLEISQRVSSTLQKSKKSEVNIYANVFSDATSMMNQFNAQLTLEKAGRISIPSVLPFFDQMLPHPSPSSTQKLTKDKNKLLQAKMKASLFCEQNIWRKQLTAAFEVSLERLKVSHSQGSICAYPFLKILPIKFYIELMIQSIDKIVTDSQLQHVSRSLLMIDLGKRVEEACIIWRKQNAGIINELSAVYENYSEMFTAHKRKIEHFREMWLCASKLRIHKGTCLDMGWPAWSGDIHLIVGRELYRIIYDHITFNSNGCRIGALPASRKETPIIFEVMSDDELTPRCEIRVHQCLLNWYRQSGYPPLMFNVSQLPMLCPPVPWTNTKQAGYLLVSSDSTRLIRKSTYSPGGDVAANDDLNFNPDTIHMVLDSLNTLSCCPWLVNNPILDMMINVARFGGDKRLNLPEVKSLIRVPSKRFDSSLSREERIKAFKNILNLQKTHDETRSLWATELYRLSIANQYRDKVFWFPHSMDFRGRVYPCPPHFHHMGSDVARGLIVFANGLPLGETGLRWLKIHLANLTGCVKRSSNDEREAYTDAILDEVFDSADKPFEGRGWWREQEEPWQTLACCRELSAALRHIDSHQPGEFVSHFPVHQDGSCNGLQHYAAMGRDERGARSVSLQDCERPRDVYTDVTEVVEAQRVVDAAAGMPVAQALEGFVQRKVIKQSVMTTVYGVTLYGAMAQIRRQLRDVSDFKSDEWLIPASAYLARLTLASISAIFTSSSDTQAWFSKLSRYITKVHGCRIGWVTPLGLPIIQPYVQASGGKDLETQVWSGSNEKSPLNMSVLIKAAALVEKQATQKNSLVGLPLPNIIKQKNAFPPNFIHSIDSCHMMLTALHCHREGIMFASVHDCFWTHAASVDRMNRICREEFVALHSEPLLENLSDYLRNKFEYSQTELDNLPSKKRAEAERFNALLVQFPKQGNFNLQEVLKSTYFFS